MKLLYSVINCSLAIVALSLPIESIAKVGIIVVPGENQVTLPCPQPSALRGMTIQLNTPSVRVEGYYFSLKEADDVTNNQKITTGLTIEKGDAIAFKGIQEDSCVYETSPHKVMLYFIPNDMKIQPKSCRKNGNDANAFLCDTTRK